MVFHYNFTEVSKNSAGIMTNFFHCYFEEIPVVFTRISMKFQYHFHYGAASDLKT